MPPRRSRTKKFTPVPKERALIPIPIEPEEVVEIVAEAVPEEPVYSPKQFELYEMRNEESIFDVPDSPFPYFIITKDELFLHKRSLIGRSITKTFMDVYRKLLPVAKKKEIAAFWWEAPKIPATLVAQIVHFFRRTYENIHAEAEVILLLSLDKTTWRLWIPAQKVSGGSVNSRYEPEDIPDGYLVVGSMHSHCNMDAFHSATDTGDAKEFDGIHLTVGKISQIVPQVAAMVMINKQQFTINYETVADFSNLNAAESPIGWDDWVAKTNEEPKRGAHLFTKYPETPRYTPPPPRQYGYQSHIPYQQRQAGWKSPFSSDDKKDVTPPPPKPAIIDGWEVDEEFRELYEKFRYDGEDGLWRPRDDAEERSSDQRTFNDVDRINWIDAQKRKKLEDTKKPKSEVDWTEFTEAQLNAVLDSELFTDEDLDYLRSNADNPLKYLRQLFTDKMTEVALILETLGLESEYFIWEPKEKEVTEDSKPNSEKGKGKN